MGSSCVTTISVTWAISTVWINSVWGICHRENPAVCRSSVITLVLCQTISYFSISYFHGKSTPTSIFQLGEEVTRCFTGGHGVSGPGGHCKKFPAALVSETSPFWGFVLSIQDHFVWEKIAQGFFAGGE